MGLSCECGEWDGDGWYWRLKTKRIAEYPVEYEYFFPLVTKRSRKCRSCKNLIEVGEECLEFERFRSAQSDIEERIYGDEVPLASWYLCAACGEIYLNLDDLGYCINIEDNMANLLAEYRAEHGVSS